MPCLEFWYLPHLSRRLEWLTSRFYVSLPQNNETVCRTEEISCSIFKCEKERNSLQGYCRKTWCIWFWLFFPPTPPPPFSARKQSLFIACGGGGRRIVGITWVLGERSGNWGSVVANCQWGEMIRISLNLTGDRVNLSWHKHHPTPPPFQAILWIMTSP